MTKFWCSAVLALASIGIAGGTHASTAQGHEAHQVSEGESMSFSAVAGARDIHEVTLNSRRFTSRDEIEGRLLLEAATQTRRSGGDWFALLPLPSERPGRHVARPDAAFGSRYGHWQPHWSYRQSDRGWQPWHPEWAVPFWTAQVDPATVEEFQVHAMIEIGRGSVPEDRETAFDARRVITDLGDPIAASHPR